MNRVTKSESRVPASLRVLSNVAVGFALSALLCAACLALWSRLGAPRTVDDSHWQGYFIHRHFWKENLPTGIAVTVCVVAGVLILAVIATRLCARTDQPVSGAGVWLPAVLALLFFGYASRGMLVFYRGVMETGSVSVAVPAGYAAWLLAIAGTTAALATPMAGRPNRSTLRPTAIGALIAIAATVSLAVGAVRAGDDVDRGFSVSRDTASAGTGPSCSPGPAAAGAAHRGRT